MHGWKYNTTIMRRKHAEREKEKKNAHLHRSTRQRFASSMKALVRYNGRSSSQQQQKSAVRVYRPQNIARTNTCKVELQSLNRSYSQPTFSYQFTTNCYCCKFCPKTKPTQHRANKKMKKKSITKHHMVGLSACHGWHDMPLSA